jgi:hypothetical protein
MVQYHYLIIRLNSKQLTPSDEYMINGFQTEKYFNHNRAEILDFIKISDGVVTKISESIQTC